MFSVHGERIRRHKSDMSVYRDASARSKRATGGLDPLLPAARWCSGALRAEVEADVCSAPIVEVHRRADDVRSLSKQRYRDGEGDLAGDGCAGSWRRAGVGRGVDGTGDHVASPDLDAIDP